MLKSILVSGGAGYIGSHTVRELAEQGYRAVILDSLVTGHKESAPEHIPFYQGDIADSSYVSQIIQEEKVDAVIHLAARSLVEESCCRPDLYFEENTAKTNRFISCLIKSGVNKIVFSSTAAVYGVPERIPVPESTPLRPVNPYGASKLMIEQSLFWLGKSYGLSWIALRYFNAAGAAFDGSMGEDHEPETHLIPLIFQTVLGQRSTARVLGSDYDTPDGTCVRDYVHVLDLARAHILALEYLNAGEGSGIFNVGTGKGYSVREVLKTAGMITKKNIPVAEVPRRPGDPAWLVAEAQMIEKRMGWAPKYSTLEEILCTAWNWHRTHPNGYSSSLEKGSEQ